MTRQEIAYWIATGLFCLAFMAGGTGHLLRADPMREGMLKLGYPLYVMTILGSAKLLGVAALACVVAMALAGFQKILTVLESVDAWVSGLRAMLMAMVI